VSNRFLLFHSCHTKIRYQSSSDSPKNRNPFVNLINYVPMTTLIRFSLILAVVFSASASFANPGSINRPSFVRSAKFLDVIGKKDSVTAKNNEPVTNEIPKATAAKVCACQILNVSSNNETLQYVAVMVEKTNLGELNNSYSKAKSVLEKEKKLMKNQFYPKMKVLDKYTVFSSCKTLAAKLAIENSELKVYDILDADILGNSNISK